ncbi:MAG: flagellar biosynthetic protein FliR [Phycisphaerae bacterium]|nr:flagellar biosynthetic protein FliR [Phycisphaerae bacterium]
MPWELMRYYTNLPLVALVFARLGGMIMFQPVLGAISVPVTVRALLILALTLIVLPFTGMPAEMPTSLAGLALGMGQELLLGGIIGVIGAVCFLGLQMGGLLIAQESGMAFGQIADPNNGDQMSVLSSLYLQLGVVFFLIVGGHRALVDASLRTYQTIPLLGGHDFTAEGTELVVAALGLGFEVALRIAAPAVVTLFLINLAMGFVARTVPQINIITLGFSIKALIGFVLIAISLPATAGVFLDALETIVDDIREMVT